MSPLVLAAALFRQHTAMMLHSAIPSEPPPPRSAPPAATPPSCYGYHNTFHTHSLPADANAAPPTYHSLTHTPPPAPAGDVLPAYSCSVELEGVLGFKSECVDVFDRTCAKDRQWQDVYVVLRGTQLNVHRIKTSLFASKRHRPAPGRLLHSYSLQHAEVGLALDFKKTELIPRSPLAKMVPLNARPAVFQTDPHLFWPVREHVMRLRMDTEQFLLCTANQEAMLDWIELLCAAVDISPPLDERSEPRYRSLPRRGRRQRQLDGRPTRQDVDLSARRLLAEQERIIRTMYPQLARDSEDEHPVSIAGAGADADMDDLDASDMLFPARSAYPQDDNTCRSNDAQAQSIDSAPASTATRRGSTDDSAPNSSKYPFGEQQEPSPSSILRYRRRCAPVLLATSPRASDVIFCDGLRLRIICKKQAFAPFKEHPPHYSAHHFSAADREACLRSSDPPASTRPDVRREASDASVALSFHRDADDMPNLAQLTPITSRVSHQRTDSDGVEVPQGEGEGEGEPQVHDSEPPSPTTATAPQLIKVESEGERGEQRSRVRFLNRAKAPLTGVAEAFGGLVI